MYIILLFVQKTRKIRNKKWILLYSTKNRGQPQIYSAKWEQKMGFFYAIKEFIFLFVLFINNFNRTICMYKEYFYIDLTRCCVVSWKGRLRCIFVSANQYYWKYTTKWDMIFCFSKTQICIFIYWKQNIVNNQTSLFYKRKHHKGQATLV